MDIQILTSCSFHVMKHYFYFFPNHLKMQKKKNLSLSAFQKQVLDLAQGFWVTEP